MEGTEQHTAGDVMSHVRGTSSLVRLACATDDDDDGDNDQPHSFIAWLCGAPYTKAAEHVRRQMDHLRSIHGEQQHVRLAHASEQKESEVKAAAVARLADVTADWNARVDEVRGANEKERAAQEARHARERAVMEASLSAQMRTLRPGPATSETMRLRSEHDAAARRVRDALRKAAALAPSVGMDFSDLDINGPHTSGVIKTLLERSASVLERRSESFARVTASGGGMEGDGDGPDGASDQRPSHSTSNAVTSTSRLNVGSLGPGTGRVLSSVMHAVTDVADMQELKAELSGMIRAESAGRMRGTMEKAVREAEKHRGELVRRHQIQADAMKRRHRSALTAAERQARSAVDATRRDGDRRVAAVRHAFAARARDMASLHANAQDVREVKRRAAREALAPFDPTSREA